MTVVCALDPPVSVGSALLLFIDAATIKPLRESMQRLALSTEVCIEVTSVPVLLNRKKFATIIVDFQLGDRARTRTLLRDVRHSLSNRTSVMFAISDSDKETAFAFEDGFNFVLRRPLSESSISQNLRAAYGLILREQRRYFRSPLEASVTLRRAGMEEIFGNVMNISEGGIAIVAPLSLTPGIEVQVQFTLPGFESQFAVKSVVCWCRDGYTGLRFVSLPTRLRTELQDWLSRRLEQSLPESVASKFRTLRLR
jgi:PilZ domain